MQWPQNILRLMIDLRHVGGTAACNLLRGVGNQQLTKEADTGKGKAGVYDHRYFNMYLPCNVTVVSYMDPVELKFGFNPTVIPSLASSIKKAAAKGPHSTFVGIKFDQVSVKSGLLMRGDQVHNPSLGAPVDVSNYT